MSIAASLQRLFGPMFALLVAVCGIGCSGSAGGINIWDAVRADDVAAIEQYKRAGGDVNVKRLSGVTPLFVALQEKKRKSYEKLLELGADPNIIAKDGRVVVNFAAGKDDSFWLELALKHKGDPNLVNAGASPQKKGTPLFFAIGTGSVENIKMLVRHGARLEDVDDFGRTALVEAMQCARFDVVLFFLEQGADYTKDVPRDPGQSFLSLVRSRKLEWFKLAKDREELIAVRKWLKKRGVKLDD